MTTVILKSKICLGFGTGTGQREVGPGRVDLSSADMSQWFIPGLIQNGTMAIVTEQNSQPAPLKYMAEHELFHQAAPVIDPTKPLVPISEEADKALQEEAAKATADALAKARAIVQNNVSPAIEEPVKIKEPEPVVAPVAARRKRG